MKKALVILIRRAVVVALACLALAACVYKLDIQQGNVIEPAKVDQLKTGMSKRQVRYLLGTPLLIDTFNQNRWDYYYSLRDYRPGDSEGKFSQERLTLIFDNGQLVTIDKHLDDHVIMPAETHRAEKSLEEKPVAPDSGDEPPRIEP